MEVVVMRPQESAGFLFDDIPYLKVGQGAALVLVLGLTFDHEILRGMSRRMALSYAAPFVQHFTVYVVTRKRGLEAGESMADIAGHLARAIDHDIGGPVFLLGMSTGGSVALQLAIDRPDLVRRLVILASACRLGDRGRAIQADLAARIRAGDPVGGWAELMAALMPEVFRWPARRVWQVALRSVVPKDSRDVLVTVEAEDVFDAETSLARITAPALVIGGENDIGYSRELFELTAAGIPDGRVHILEGKGHMLAANAAVWSLALGFMLGEASTSHS